MAAIAKGRVVDTTMGLTPLEGLVMGTRSGDLDPALVFHVARQSGASLDELDEAIDDCVRGVFDTFEEEASKTKLIAARDLGLPVLMIARPAPGDWAQVPDVQAALQWVAGL